jgi:endoglucanase
MSNNTFRRALSATVFAIALFISAACNAAEIRVSGNRFLRDGKPWIAEGVVLVGLLASAEKFKRPAYDKAHKMFGPKLLDDIRAYGADTIRVKARQEGLDPRSQFYLPGYRDEVVQNIKQIRNNGFIVVVSMLSLLAEGGMPVAKGTPLSARMPSEDTARAWSEIIKDIGQDKGILLEIYDEPGITKPTPENWEIWREGMQLVVDSLRKNGAQNVLLLDGLRTAHILEGAPEIKDPLDQIGFAIHPYLFRRSRTEAQWEKQFGRFARSKPVMATEWNALSNRQAQCDANQPERASKFLSYLQERQIGLIIWAFDLPGVRRGQKLTSFRNHACGSRNKAVRSGAGELVRDYFQAN